MSLCVLMLLILAWHDVSGQKRPAPGINRHNHNTRSHDDERFAAAQALYNNGEYEKALALFKENIHENPKALNVDYDYAWSTLCLARLCRYQEFVTFYEIVSTRYFGTVVNGGGPRDWVRTLKEARSTILACPFMNAATITARLDGIDQRGRNALKIKLENLIHLASMGNRSAINDLKYYDDEILQFIADGQLVLERDAVADTLPRKADAPYIRKRGDNAVLYLPEAMQAAIERFDPDFRTWKMSNYTPELRSWYDYSEFNLPFAVVGDFNGDSIKDVVLHGHTRKAEVFLCVLSADSGFRTLPVEMYEQSGLSDSTIFETFLTLEEPRDIKTGYEEYTLHLTTDAFSICYFEKAGSLYYYKNN
ncbi:MAG TPA: hypothetical protein VI758_08310, partial [Bacteroidota bacterium]